MHKLKIEQAIFEQYRDYAAQVIYAEGLVNGTSDDYSIGVLREAEEQARAAFSGKQVTEHSHIQAWHRAFEKFGIKPKKYPTGAEALLKRVLAGHQLPAINRIVDCYNAISLKWVIPVGGEDWEELQSDLCLKYSSGDEPFITNGVNGEKIDYPQPGEIVWSDMAGVTVRAWNWRQCTRTFITPNTRNAYFVLDRLEPYPVEQMVEAGTELITHLQRIAPGCQIHREFFM